MKKKSNEFKVGLLITVSVAILLFLMYKIGDLNFNKEGYNIKVLFNSASGIEPNSPVRLAGVEVGTLKTIELAYDDATKVVLDMWLVKGTQLRSDSKAFISTLGLMGTKYVEITPGMEGVLVEPGDTLIGVDPFQMEALIEKGEAVADELEKTLRNLDILSGNVNEIVVENKENISVIMANLRDTSENVKDLTGDLKKNPWKVITKPKGWKKMDKLCIFHGNCADGFGANAELAVQLVNKLIGS